MADYHGTQCGFCSPGMVMTMKSLIDSKEGAAAPSTAEVENVLDGNICRCTGYRPILEGLKTLTSDRWAAAAVNGASNGTNGTNGVCGLGEKCCKNGGGQNGEAEEEDRTTTGYNQVAHSRCIQYLVSTLSTV